MSLSEVLQFLLGPYLANPKNYAGAPEEVASIDVVGKDVDGEAG